MNVEPGDIVQITNERHHWFPALVVVSETKSFGCQGYANVPVAGEGNNMRGQAYIRLNLDDYERVGKAVFVAQ